ncbi:MAG: HPr kinase/phosphorylase [Alkalilacustris sp.]
MMVHASCVAVLPPAGGPARAALLMGPSGTGKSTLALAMLGLGARLVADDRTRLVRAGAHLLASAPPAIRGLIEARGLGLLRAPSLGSARVVLAVDLSQPAPTRLPAPQIWSALGVEVALLRSLETVSLPSSLMLYLSTGRRDVA